MPSFPDGFSFSQGFHRQRPAPPRHTQLTALPGSRHPAFISLTVQAKRRGTHVPFAATNLASMDPAIKKPCQKGVPRIGGTPCFLSSVDRDELMVQAVLDKVGRGGNDKQLSAALKSILRNLRHAFGKIRFPQP